MQVSQSDCAYVWLSSFYVNLEFKICTYLSMYNHDTVFRMLRSREVYVDDPRILQRRTWMCDYV